MMYNFPFYPHFPTKSYRDYPHNFNKSPLRNPNHTIRHSTETNSLRKNNHKKYDTRNEKKSEIKADDRYKGTDDENYFEILGIKLYSDDILLLCLIFFLYKEDVHDEYLFIALIMLLLS